MPGVRYAGDGAGAGGRGAAGGDRAGRGVWGGGGPAVVDFAARLCPYGFCEFAAGTEVFFAEQVTGAPTEYRYDWMGSGVFTEVSAAPVTSHLYAAAVGEVRPVLHLASVGDSMAKLDVLLSHSHSALDHFVGGIQELQKTCPGPAKGIREFQAGQVEFAATNSVQDPEAVVQYAISQTTAACASRRLGN